MSPTPPLRNWRGVVHAHHTVGQALQLLRNTEIPPREYEELLTLLEEAYRHLSYTVREVAEEHPQPPEPREEA